MTYTLIQTNCLHLQQQRQATTNQLKKKVVKKAKDSTVLQRGPTGFIVILHYLLSQTTIFLGTIPIRVKLNDGEAFISIETCLWKCL